jgi:purine-nucleoside phosphorylase
LEPVLSLVLGSGLGDAVAGDVNPDQEFAFEALPGFPPPSVPGHAARLVVGTLYGVPTAVFRGRVHYYEGRGMASTTLIPRLAAALGIRTLVLTNAAGGLNPSFQVGSLMLIEDHINFMGVNPLMGWRFPDGRPAFVDLSRVWDPGLRETAERVARREGITLRRGVYVALSGPSYETRAETAMLARLGADAVGMSTVPEAVGAAALGLTVMGISCITNVAGTDASHEEVLQAGKGAAKDLRALLAGVLPELAVEWASGHHGGPGG